MSNLDRILAIDEQNRLEYPKTYKAKDLLLKGHLTTEEFNRIAKGEVMDRYIDKTETLSENSGIILPESVLPPMSDIEKIKKTAEDFIDEGIKAWMPTQIDHVVIRTTRLDNPRHEYNALIFTIRIKLFNVLQETVQELATDVSVEDSVKDLPEAEAKTYWVMFNQCIANQLTQIILQLIMGIKSNQF